MAVGPAHRALRDACQAAHQQLEDSLPLLRDDLDLPSYVAFLRRFYPVVHSLEHNLLQWEGPVAHHGYCLEPGSRALRLSRDIEVLGAAVPPCVPPVPAPMPTSLAEAIGQLYVLEGSALGGQVIARRLGPRLGLSPSHGCAYFSGRGAQTAPHWRHLCALLEASLGEAAAMRAAAAAACQSFAFVEQALRPPW
ncbi:MAG: hypothetical protein EOO40_12335 [Deltaproteobacteria bacterium]|nr:MAG: hypothetical protein EOO40_12335 [Deltaproteobacteria bacterium]